MGDQWWSWILTVVGLTGFILAGRKVWWCWYVNILCQGLWFAYAIITHQYGFIVASLAYTVVFSQNAYKWTKEHREKNALATLDGAIEADEYPLVRCTCGETKGLHYPDCPLYPEWMKKGGK